jgi:hypothetical protein
MSTTYGQISLADVAIDKLTFQNLAVSLRATGFNI